MQNHFKKKNETMFEEANSFKDFFQTPFFKNEASLRCDIIENDTSYTLVMDIPGCKKDDVKISNEDGYLTIKVTTNSSSEIENKNYLKRERLHGTYKRSYYIGNTIDSKDINASFANGLLSINIPKDNQSNSTTYIPIK